MPTPRGSTVPVGGHLEGRTEAANRTARSEAHRAPRPTALSSRRRRRGRTRSSVASPATPGLLHRAGGSGAEPRRPLDRREVGGERQGQGEDSSTDARPASALRGGAGAFPTHRWRGPDQRGAPLPRGRHLRRTSWSATLAAPQLQPRRGSASRALARLLGSTRRSRDDERDARAVGHRRAARGARARRRTAHAPVHPRRAASHVSPTRRARRPLPTVAPIRRGRAGHRQRDQRRREACGHARAAA